MTFQPMDPAKPLDALRAVHAPGSSLTGRDRNVLTAVILHINTGTGTTPLSFKRLAEVAGVAVKSARTAVHRLEDGGWLQRTMPRPGCAPIYTVQIPELPFWSKRKAEGSPPPKKAGGPKMGEGSEMGSSLPPEIGSSPPPENGGRVPPKMGARTAVSTAASTEGSTEAVPLEVSRLHDMWQEATGGRIRQLEEFGAEVAPLIERQGEAWVRARLAEHLTSAGEFLGWRAFIENPGRYRNGNADSASPTPAVVNDPPEDTMGPAIDEWISKHKDDVAGIRATALQEVQADPQYRDSTLPAQRMVAELKVRNAARERIEAKA